MTDSTWLFSGEDSLFYFLKKYIFWLFQKEKLEFLNYIFRDWGRNCSRLCILKHSSRTPSHINIKLMKRANKAQLILILLFSHLLLDHCPLTWEETSSSFVRHITRKLCYSAPGKQNTKSSVCDFWPGFSTSLLPCPLRVPLQVVDPAVGTYVHLTLPPPHACSKTVA